MRMDFDTTKIIAICIISIFIFASVSIYSENMPSGSSDINVTVNGSTLWNGAWNTTVISLISSNQDKNWQSLWNATVQSIIDDNNLSSWNPIWNSTVSELISNYLANYSWESESSYTIFYDSSDSLYKAKNGGTGQIDYSSTNVTYICEQVRSSLTANRKWFETILLKGSFTLSGSILMDSWTILDLRQAEIILPVGATYPAIRNTNQTNGNTKMSVFGGEINGSRGEGNNNVNAKGIYINNNGVDMEPSRVIEVFDTVIFNVYGNAFDIQLNTGDSLNLENTKCENRGGNDCTRIAYNLKAGDSQLTTIDANSYYENLVLEGGTFQIINSYFGGGGGSGSSNATVHFKGNVRGQMTNCLVDASYKHAILLENSDWNHFVNVRVRGKDVLTANNTWSVFRLVNSKNNIIEACYGGRYDTVVTDFYKYGVEETGTSDINMVVGSNFRDIGTIGIIVVGANTKVACSWNGTSWIS